MRNDLVQLGIDLAEGKIAKFENVNPNEAFRQELLKICGTEKIDLKSFRKHKTEIFEVIEEVLDVVVPKMVEQQFERFVEVKNVSWGDSLEFDVPDTEFYKVATIAYGNGNIRRQRIELGHPIKVDTKMRGIKLYAPVYQFLAGKIDWTAVVKKAEDSFARHIQLEIFDTFVKSFSSLGAIYGISGTFDYAKFVELASHIQAETGMSITCYGTKSALSKVTSLAPHISDRAKDSINEKGYLGVVDGIQLVELEQSHKIGTDEFAIDNKMLVLVPTGYEKIVKLVFEGDSIISEPADNTNADMSKEFLLEKAYGLAVVPSTKYGIIKFD